MAIYVFLLGFLPFVNFYRFKPIPSFWVQWVVFFVATLFVIKLQRRRKFAINGRSELSLISIVLVAFAVLILWQINIGIIRYKVSALFVVMVLLVGAYLHGMIRNGLGEGEKDRMIVWWAKGVGCAFVLQVVASVLLWRGYVIAVPFELIRVSAPDRIFGTFGQPNQFGVFAALSLSVIIFLAQRKHISEVFFLLGWCASAAMCAASGSRAALCVWLLLFAVDVVQVWRRAHVSTWTSSTNGWRLLCLHVLFGGVQLIWAASSVVPEKSGVAGENTLLRGDPIVARIEQYRDSFLLFVDRPIFGYGLDNFASSRFYHLDGSLMEPQSTHTHNIFTNALVEFGVLGGVLVVAIFACVAMSARRAPFPGVQGQDSVRMAAVWSLGWLVYACLEYPFHYVHFLYSFLFSSAMLPVGGFSFDRERLNIWRWGRWIVPSIALLMSVLVAADYRRLQVMVQNLEGQIKLYGSVKSPPSLEYLTRLRLQSFYSHHVDYYWMKSLGISGDISRQKIEVAKELFDQTPSGDSLAWYAIQLISGGQNEEALALLCNFGSRNKHEFGIGMSRLHLFASAYAPATEFLDENSIRLSRRCR